MKKLSLFVMPLMAVSFLVSCGGNNTPQIVEHFVTFESKGGTHIDTQRIKDGGTATEPTKTPERADYEFKGWFTDDLTFENEYKFTELVTDDVTLYAKWEPTGATTYTITFMKDGAYYDDIDDIEPGHIIENTELPEAPEKSGYTFTGWCADEGGKNIFDFSKIKIYQNHTLYAGWEPVQPVPVDTYLVDFNGAGCKAKLGDTDPFTGDIFEKGEEIELTISPLTDHFELNDTISVKINGTEATPETDYTYAKIGDTKNYKLTFEVQGRTDINVGTTEYCLLTYDCSAAEADPTTKWIKKGEVLEDYLDPIPVDYYVFNGWYIDSEFQYECNPAQKIFEDTTIYGSYDADDPIKTPLTFTCTNLGEDGEASVELYASNTTSSSFTRHLKYRINNGDWKPIADANQDGEFTIEPTDGKHIKILQDGEKLLNEGDTIQIKGNNSNFSQTTQGQLILRFRTGSDETDTFDVSGNIMSLAYEESFGENKIIPNNNFFESMFDSSEPYDDEGYCNIVNADNLLLPAETLKASCYAYLFSENKKLVNAPKLLPATDLPLFAYDSMFSGCSSLETAPELFAINFSDDNHSCESMFKDCVNLKELKVAFGNEGSSEWPSESETHEWLLNAGTSAQEPVFYWKGVDDPNRTLVAKDDSHVPDNWAVRHY